MTPESAAKIGYLWLHQGNWNGKQIVSREWVLDSVRRHSTKVGHDSGYSNGWWINFSHYFAAGRGGQDIRVIPALNAIVVTTGGSFEMPEIEDYLFPILLRSARTRPANLDGEAALQETLASIQQKETVPVVSASSEVAKVVSNRTYQCHNNPAGLQLLRMDFSDPMTAKLYQKSFGQDMLWEIGLDGRYRQTADGDAVLGYWEDASTFHLEIFDIGTQVFSVKLEAEPLRVSGEDADLTIDCQLLPQ